jgi:outer membrane protein assembly factor BamB
MARCYTIALFGLFSLTPLAFAVISAASPLKDILGDLPYVFVAKVEKIDEAKPAVIFAVEQDLKGKFDFRRLPVVFNGDSDAAELKHVPLLLKRLATGLPTVWFVQMRGKRITSFVYTNGTWMQILGEKVEKERAVFNLAHGEPNLRQTFKGSTAQLIDVVKDALSGKKQPPEIDKNEPPGFGPEATQKQSRATTLSPTFTSGGTLFAVIPTLGIAGPIAILAILFPTVFGGVLILFRQWTAFITAFSLNSTLYLLYWWKGGVWLRSTWWNTEPGIWFVMSLLTAICLLWAWRRQLANLAEGADALETPVRTEFLVLSVLTLTCVGFVIGTWWFAPPSPSDVVWNYTLVLTAAVIGGLIYRVFRGTFEVMLPMPTEGVMLGVASLAHLSVFAFLTHSLGASLGGSLETPHDTDAGGPKPEFVGVKWRFPTKESGLFVSSPLVDGNRVLAASAHPSFKGGTLWCLNLNSGKEIWNFIDDGDLKQVFSSPAIADGKVFIGEGFHEDPACKLYCVDGASGEKIWEFKTKSQTEATPAIAGGKVYQGCGNDGLFCFAADAQGSGKILWQYPPKGAKGRLLRFGAGAAVHGGKVYAGTGVDRLQKGDPGETLFVCLDADSGAEVWKIPMPLPVWAAPAIFDNRLYVAVGNGDVFSSADAPAGRLFCFDLMSGKEHWNVDLPDGVLQKPAVDERNIYVSCRDNHCYAFDRVSGVQRWKADLGSPVVASPAIARSLNDHSTRAVFAVSSNGKLACLNPTTGTPFWSYPITSPLAMTFIAAPAIAVRPIEGGEQCLIILGGGDNLSGAKATLLCIEARLAN